MHQTASTYIARTISEMRFICSVLWCFYVIFSQDESEDYVAHMWRRVALSSKETLEQLISYQAAIEALNVSRVYIRNTTTLISNVDKKVFVVCVRIYLQYIMLPTYVNPLIIMFLRSWHWLFMLCNL